MSNLNSDLKGLINERKKLFATLPTEKNIQQYLNQHTLLVDKIIQNRWQHCGLDSLNLSIYATGGYARKELFIHSDVDLIILCAENFTQEIEQKLSDFLMQLWDIKISISHYIGDIASLTLSALTDLGRYTNLLEMRHITGATIDNCTFNRIIQQKSVHQFYQEKLLEQQERHKNYGETSYLLEPNIKESPGGLRDVHTLNWLLLRIVIQATHSIENLLTQEEQRELTSYVNFFNFLRWILHFSAKRTEERLLFEHQKNIAKLLKYPGDTINQSIEKLMNHYYLTTKKSNTILDILSQAINHVILDKNIQTIEINDYLQQQDTCLTISSQAKINAQPELIFTVFQYIADHPECQGFSIETIRYFRSLIAKIVEYRSEQSFRAAFIEFIAKTNNLETALRLMHRYDLLGAYIPDFQRLTGRMQYDLFHVYTVDKHLLTIIKILCSFETADAAKSYPTCHKIIVQLSNKLVLRLAGLFHDIGKGLQGNHSVLGAEIAKEFALQHNLSIEQTELLMWLVENHLLMSLTAQKKDIYDPQVIEEFAKNIKSKQRLNYLYVLTVADTIATNPKLWNSWKSTLLRQLYDACLSCLSTESKQYPTHSIVAMTQQQALATLIEENYDERAIKALWFNWQEKYFLRHSPKNVVAHTKAILNAAPDVTVLVKSLSGQKAFDVFIYMRDKPLIVATTTRLFDKLQLSIAEAQILTTKDNYTLDSYVLIKTDATKVSTSCEQIQALLLRNLQGELSISPANKRFMSRRQRHFTMKTIIAFHEDSKNNRTVMTLLTTDTTGLIATIAKAFAKHKIQIQHAKIATMGERAEDTFFIVDKSKEPLSEALQMSLKDTIIKLLGE